MITRDTKISHLLKEYPAALDVLLSASPMFKRLNNPILRKTLAPRVTLRQAAEIGGVDLEELLLALRRATGTNGPLPAKNPAEPEPQKSNKVAQIRPAVLENIPDDRVVILDVRPIIDSGSDPFRTIMKTVKSLGEAQVLHLINTFEPIPLYDVLQRRGFHHWTSEDDGTWHVWFYGDSTKTPQDGTAAHPGKQAVPAQASPNDPRVVEIDVRGLEPPEPMMRVLETLNTLGEDSVLLVHHHREPMMLYEKLEARGYRASAEKMREDYYRVTIQKKG